jgi:hypothetical protein
MPEEFQLGQPVVKTATFVNGYTMRNGYSSSSSPPPPSPLPQHQYQQPQPRTGAASKAGARLMPDLTAYLMPFERGFRDQATTAELHPGV